VGVKRQQGGCKRAAEKVRGRVSLQAITSAGGSAESYAPQVSVGCEGQQGNVMPGSARH
jgi:hypothetical protein